MPKNKWYNWTETLCIRFVSFRMNNKHFAESEMQVVRKTYFCLYSSSGEGVSPL